jgi:hypothetical protein
MKKLFSSIIVAVFIICFSSLIQAQDVIRIGLAAAYKENTLKLSSKKIPGYSQTMFISDCPSLDSPVLKDIQRSTIELMFVCHALKNAKIGTKFVLVPSPNVKRTLLRLENHEIDIEGTSKFKKALVDRKLLTSDALLRQGEFVLGLFTTPNRKEVLSLQTMEELRKHIGVTVEHWKMGRAVMEQINLKKVRFVGKFPHIARAILTKRGDFTFNKLKTPSVGSGDSKILRIDGFKASLPDERVLAISLKRRDIFQAVQNFIKQSRKPVDQIRKAYIHSGFIALDYENWIDVRLAK